MPSTSGTETIKESSNLNIEKLNGVKLSAVTRKILRSKKLTKFFILSKRKYLRSISIVDLKSPPRIGEIQIAPPQKLTVLSPRFLSSGDMSVEATRHASEHFPSSSLTRIKNAIAFGGSNRLIVDKFVVNHGFFCLDTDLTLEEFHQTLKFDCDTGTALKITRDPSPVKIRSAAAFTDAAAQNYAHWITEVLIRIFAFQTTKESEGVPIIIDDGLHQNIMRTLEIILRPGTKIYLLPKNREVIIESLWHTAALGYIPVEPRKKPSPPLSHGIFSHALLSRMTSVIKEAIIPKQAAQPRRRLYVKRNSTYRNIVNQTEVDQLLMNLGFEIIEPEKMSFDEQVQAFHSATVIIGATGAAMVNVIFCQPDCEIFILISDHPETPYFYWQNIASSVNQRINYIICEALGETRQSVHTDFVAPIQRMQDLLGHSDEAQSDFGKRVGSL